MTYLEDKPAPTAPATTTSYDSATPAALVEFMLKEWKAGNGTPPKPIANHGVFEARRRALSALFPGEWL
ncbi:MAG TPA: hypothetical protein VHZ95_00345, partial [Polyangiales bacterium]|nr:hypothetical protein [Polyangiales bacterium]